MRISDAPAGARTLARSVAGEAQRRGEYSEVHHRQPVSRLNVHRFEASSSRDPEEQRGGGKLEHDRARRVDPAPQGRDATMCIAYSTPLISVSASPQPMVIARVSEIRAMPARHRSAAAKLLPADAALDPPRKKRHQHAVDRGQKRVFFRGWCRDAVGIISDAAARITPSTAERQMSGKEDERTFFQNTARAAPPRSRSAARGANPAERHPSDP